MFLSLKHFKASEFSEPDSMSPAFLFWLDAVRDLAGVPFYITSSFRRGDDGLHGRGMAVDLDSRRWNAVQKWAVASAVLQLAYDAPGAVEFETVYSERDKHWHLAVDPRPGKQHEFIEADD